MHADWGLGGRVAISGAWDSTDPGDQTECSHNMFALRTLGTQSGPLWKEEKTQIDERLFLALRQNQGKIQKLHCCDSSCTSEICTC